MSAGTITALVETLVACGATPEMILAAVRTAEKQKDAALELSREKARSRVQKWRDRQDETSRNVTQRSVPITKRLTRAEPNSSTQEISVKEVKEERTSPAARSTRGSRIPEGFTPDIDAAVSEGLSRQEAERQALSFCDYWRSKPGAAALKLDWPATWRMWFRRRVDEKPQQHRATAPPRTVSDVLGDIKAGRLEVPSILDMIKGKTDEPPEHFGPTIDAGFERPDLGGAGRVNQLYAFPSGRRS